MQSSVILNHQMSSFMVTYNAGAGNPEPITYDPDIVPEYYENLLGNFRDGTPMTIGGDGFNPSSIDTTKFAFFDDPSDPTGWSMTASGFPARDPRALASIDVGTFEPGQIVTLDMAHIYSNGEGLNNLQNVTKAKDDIREVKTIYDTMFDQTCAILSRTSDPAIATLSIHPNPSDGVIYIPPSSDFNRFEIFNSEGRMITQGVISLQESRKVRIAEQRVYIAKFMNDMDGNHSFSKVVIKNL